MKGGTIQPSKAVRKGGFSIFEGSRDTARDTFSLVLSLLMLGGVYIWVGGETFQRRKMKG